MIRSIGMYVRQEIQVFLLKLVAKVEITYVMYLQFKSCCAC